MVTTRSNYVLDHYEHTSPEGHVDGVVYTLSTRAGVQLAEGVGIDLTEALADLSAQVYLVSCLGCGREIACLRVDGEPDTHCVDCKVAVATSYRQPTAVRRAVLRAQITQPLVSPAITAEQAAALRAKVRS